MPNWSAPPWPTGDAMAGQYCRLERLDASRHATALSAAFSSAPDMWTYLPYGPFEDFLAFESWVREMSTANDPLSFAIFEPLSDQPAGIAAFLRIAPASGALEVGHVIFSPRLQKTRIATDAMYLMMKRAFALGYRRYEWKCDSLHARSRAAAERLGFAFEGIFRQALVYKGRNRDTAWYSVIDREWPALEKAFLAWLNPENFDEHGRQRVRLGDLTRQLRT